MTVVFGDFDAADFWGPSDYSKREHEELWPTDELIASIERELGYRLPRSYVELMRVQNGGLPRRTCFRTATRTTWAEDHVAIHDIKAIGRTQQWSLCGDIGSRLLLDEWGYPPLGVYFGDCPSSGHDAFALDYRGCGPAGEPSVVHVDQEVDYRITSVAPTFEAFIRGLEPEDAFPLD